MDYKVRVHSPDHDGIAKLYVEAWVGPIPKEEVREKIIYQQIFFSRILSGLLSNLSSLLSFVLTQFINPFTANVIYETEHLLL